MGPMQSDRSSRLLRLFTLIRRIDVPLGFGWRAGPIPTLTAIAVVAVGLGVAAAVAIPRAHVPQPSTGAPSNPVRLLAGKVVAGPGPSSGCGARTLNFTWTVAGAPAFAPVDVDLQGPRTKGKFATAVGANGREVHLAVAVVPPGRWTARVTGIGRHQPVIAAAGTSPTITLTCST